MKDNIKTILESLQNEVLKEESPLEDFYNRNSKKDSLHKFIRTVYTDLKVFDEQVISFLNEEETQNLHKRLKDFYDYLRILTKNTYKR